MIPGVGEKIGPGRLIVLVGPSGAGKDTLLNHAQQRLARNPSFVFPRRVVTRPSSAAEDNVSLSAADFKVAVARKDFAFWWDAHGHLYGLPASLNGDIAARRTVMCNVSRAVVDSLRLRYRHVLCILVTAPPEILAARIGRRGRVSDGPANLRMMRSDKFSSFEPDWTIQNGGEIDDAVAGLLEIIDINTPRAPDLGRPSTSPSS